MENSKNHGSNIFVPWKIVKFHGSSHHQAVIGRRLIGQRNGKASDDEAGESLV